MAIYIIKHAVISLLWFIVTNLILTPISWVVFPVAYIWRSKVYNYSSSTIIKNRLYTHELWKLPDWAYWFDNARSDNPPDGLYGDHGGQNKSFRDGKPFGTSFKDAWWFSVSRNNINGFKRIYLGIKEIKSVKVLAGKDGWVETRKADSNYHGWHFLKAETEKGTKYMFHMYLPKPDKDRLYYIKIGWKLRVEKNLSAPMSYPRGFTFRWHVWDMKGKHTWEFYLSVLIFISPFVYGLWRVTI